MILHEVCSVTESVKMYEFDLGRANVNLKCWSISSFLNDEAGLLISDALREVDPPEKLHISLRLERTDFDSAQRRAAFRHAHVLAPSVRRAVPSTDHEG